MNKNRWKRWYLTACGLFMMGGLKVFGSAEDATQSAARPNVVFIFVDDLGWGDLGVYGNLEINTPRLDQMSRDGILFQQFYVNASLCSPSRAGLLTGLFPARLGIHYWMNRQHNEKLGMPAGLDPTIQTVPGRLRDAGYKTAHIGKWHIGERPRGADFGTDIWRGPGDGHDPKRFARIVDDTIKFIQDSRSEGKPFFVNLWPLDVHAPLKPSEEMLAGYSHKRTAQDITAMMIYYAAVTEMDAQVGRLLDFIDAQPGLAEETLIIFTSDNGPEDIYIPDAGYSSVGSPGPFRGRKRSLYEGGIRMPFIARWEGVIPAGKVDGRSVISAVDMLPTLCRLAGAEFSEVDGEDITDALLGNATHVREKPLLWEYRIEGYGPVINHSPMLAIRDGDWKLLFNPDGSRTELYHIPTEYRELNNRAAEHKDVVERLKQIALDWQETLPPGEYSPRAGDDSYPAMPERFWLKPWLAAELEKRLSNVRINLDNPPE